MEKTRKPRFQLVSFIKPYWKFAVAAPLLMLLEVVCDLMQPQFMARIIDDGVAKGDIQLIIKLGVYMFVAAILGIVGGVGCTIFATFASQNYGRDIREELFKRVESFSFRNMDKFSTASLITRLTNDVIQIQGIVLMMLRIMVRAPILMVGGIILSFAMNAKLALTALSVLPFLVIVIIITMKKGFPLFAKVQDRLDRLNLVIRENLTGIRVVKAFVRAEHENKRFKNSNENLSEMTVRAMRTVGLGMPIMFFIMNIGIILAIWFGGYQVQEGNVQVGEIMALLNYITQILFSLMMTAMLVMNFSRAKVSADRIREVLQEESDLKDGQMELPENEMNSRESGSKVPDDKDKNILESNRNKIDNQQYENHEKDSHQIRNKKIAGQELYKQVLDNEESQKRLKGSVVFENVSFKYDGSKGENVLKNISFIAEPGKTLAILGATGVGKSTLVNLIPRFYDTDSGSVFVHGYHVKELKMDELRKDIGIVLQESILFSGTIKENMLWGDQNATEEMIVEAAKVAQAHEFIMSFPLGYETIIGQRGVNLSGGQKQRLSIARALLKKPSILILDDSTSAVDLGTEARFRASLGTYMEHLTVILIAQRVNSVMSADKILVLHHGEVSGLATHEELIATNEVYQEIYRSQVGEADLDLLEDTVNEYK